MKNCYFSLRYPLSLLFLAFVANPLMADPVSLDLSVLGGHGTALIGPTAVPGFGVTITINNPNPGSVYPDQGAIFDTTENNTYDPDLEGPNWATGQPTSLNIVVGLALIVQESNGNAGGAGDDEGRRPAGTMTFEFDSSITQFGTTLLDIEGTGPSDEPGSIEFFDGVNSLGTVSFMDFVGRDGALYGNNSINVIAPITAAELNATSFDKVVIHMGGSGAAGAFNWYTVPEPGSIILLGAGLFGLAGVRRKLSIK